MYKIKMSARFKKEYKLAKRRGCNPALLLEAVTILAEGDELPEKNKDHALAGSWASYRECHLAPDWLLIYRVESDILVLTLTRTGSHSDLF